MNVSNPRGRWIALAVAAAAALLWPSTAAAEVETTSLSILVLALRFAASSAEPVLREVAVPMAISLATIDVVVYALKNSTKLSLHHLGVRLAILGFFIAAAANNTPVLSARQIVRGAEEIAAAVSGLEGIDPSEIVDQGIYLFGLMFGNLFDFGLIATGGITEVIAHYIAALGTLLAFTLVALQVTLTLVQGAYLVTLSPLFMAFGTSRWTIAMTEGYLNVLLWWSIKLILLAVTLSIGNELARISETLLRTAEDFGLSFVAERAMYWQVAVHTAGYGLAAAFVPGMLSTKLSAKIEISQLLTGD